MTCPHCENGRVPAGPDTWEPCDECDAGAAEADELRADAECEREIDRLGAIGLDPWGHEK